MDGWYILGVGNFALEVLNWSLDSGLPKTAFLGFLGDESQSAIESTGFRCVPEDEVEFSDATPIVNAISTPSVKRKVCAKLKANGAIFKSVVHPTSVFNAEQSGEGVLVCPHCVVGPQVILGDFVTLNYHTGIGHETAVGDYVSTAPGVQVGGNSQIGAACYLGMNSCVIDKVQLGDEVVASAGSVIISRLKAGARVSGNPARKSRAF